MAKKNDFRKRYLVTEGELFQLYADIQQMRCKDRRESFMKDFRQLLRESQQVELTVKERKEVCDGAL